eukprot:CAMPEP_0176441504 /NCGR_PEP_ID=MMETSP0127-20121128/21236_1 /TAXON_ID=938130 /ORGANISM="Platyophrya macrostoma, Strain WH" /LENGTH=307 /DNA_ID=CAMNT_0017826293 /DNA_START=171 /DNA_END=1094 /DNA_ORIENTATION=+
MATFKMFFTLEEENIKEKNEGEQSKEQKAEITKHESETRVKQLLQNHQRKIMMQKKQKGTMFINELWDERYYKQVLQTTEIMEMHEQMQKALRNGNLGEAQRQNKGDSNLSNDERTPKHIKDGFKLPEIKSSESPVNRAAGPKNTLDLRRAPPMQELFALPSVRLSLAPDHNSEGNQNFTDRSISNRPGEERNFQSKETYTRFQKPIHRPNKRRYNHKSPLAAKVNDSLEVILEKCDNLIYDSEIPHLLSKIAQEKISSSPTRSAQKGNAKAKNAALVRDETIKEFKRILDVNHNNNLAYATRTPKR